ncbi:Lnb N-terminal periplasmic domain-containing protein [Arcobacter porcinus]|uniref:Lnb N-terminal periplasmic domain-containing protein n=1 Tax=Arcobacter porcinus TaxID=1935204 RepID=UPI000826B2EC|nr:DUF4105 domain-containing protein [Arcobacter porcinus]OCL89149.1 hypothetical protein AAX30_00286 [Arcobacter porcinus]
MQNLCNLSKKVTKSFLFCCFFLSPLFSNDIYNLAIEKKLYEDSYFKKLFHYKSSSSEIDSNNFFISKNGKYDLKDELIETLKALENGTDNVLCRFPLRVDFLKENIPNLDNIIKKYECSELKEYKKTLNANFISLVFPASHINSPASMYGHTFLKISSQKDSPLLSYALNYAAETNEKNGLVFAIKGIFGGYEGKYTIQPYYEKLKTYNNIEQRDVWEYDLNLEKDEIDRLVLHSWELKDSFADYFFFKENCSYSLLWLFEVARPNLELTDHFTFKTIPLDTIKLLDNEKLIDDSKYRYSTMKKMKYLLNEKIENKEFINDFIKKDKTLENSLSKEDKIAYLDLKIAYTQYLRSEKGTDKSNYVKNYLATLKERSSYPISSEFDIEAPINPIYSHNSSRVGFFYDSNDNFEFSIKPAYHDIYDVEDGYLQGAYIDFFELNLKKEKNEDIKIDKITLLNIESFSPRDQLFKSLSWTINTGYEKFDFNNDDSFKINPSFGASFGIDSTFAYILLDLNSFFTSKEQFYSVGPRAGIVSNYFKNIKLGLDYRYAKFDKGFERNNFEAFSTFKLNKDFALNLKYLNNDLEKNQDSLKFGFYYYFIP